MINTSAPTLPLAVVPSTTMKDAMRVHCCAGRAMLISHLLPTYYTTWCPRCKRAHVVAWQDFPSEALRDVLSAIAHVLVERDGQASAAGVE